MNINPKMKTNYVSNEWYCLDFTDSNYQLGGEWGLEFLNYNTLDIDFCN